MPGFGDSLDYNSDVNALYNPQMDPNLQSPNALIGIRDTPGPEIARSPRQAAPQQQNAQESDDTLLTAPKKEHLTFLQGLVAALGGPTAGSAIRSQIIQKQMAPVLGEAGRKLSKALSNGDVDTADSLINQLNQYSDMSPGIGELIKRASAKTDEKRKAIEGNTTLLKLAEMKLKDDPMAQQAIGVMKSRVGQIDTKDLAAAIESYAPHITVEQNWTQATNKYNADVIKRNLTPTVLKETDLPATVSTILVQMAGPEGIRDFIGLTNDWNNDKPLTKSQVERLQRYNQGVQQGARQETTFNRLNPRDAVEMGVGVPGGPARGGLTGVDQIPSVQAPGMTAPPQQAPIAPGTQPQPQRGLRGSQQPQLGGNPTQSSPIEVTPGMIQRVIPGAPPEVMQQIMDDPQGQQQIGQLYQDKLAGMTDAQRAREFQLRQQAEKTFRDQEAFQRAATANKPVGEAVTIWEPGPNGVPKEFNKKALSEDERLKLKLYKSADASESPLIKNAFSAIGEGKTLYSDLLKAKPEDFSMVNRLLSAGMVVPINIPGTGLGVNIQVPGVGSVAMTRNQAELFNKIVFFAQNSEAFVNVPGVENQYVAAMKQGMTGAFANKDSSLLTVKNIVDTTAGRLGDKMAQTTGNPTFTYKSTLNLPEPTSQNGVQEKADTIRDNVYSVFGTTAQEIAQKGVNAVANSPGAKALPDILKFLKEYNPLSADNIDKREAVKTVNDINLNNLEEAKAKKIKNWLYDFIGTMTNAKPKEGYKNTYQAVTPKWAQKPINPNTVDKLRGFNE